MMISVMHVLVIVDVVRVPVGTVGFVVVPVVVAVVVAVVRRRLRAAAFVVVGVFVALVVIVGRVALQRLRGLGTSQQEHDRD